MDNSYTQAEHANAVASARTAGLNEGARAERHRFAAILSANSLKSSPSRLKAAIDLAIKSPGMSAENVVSFVTAHQVREPRSMSKGRLTKLATNLEARNPGQIGAEGVGKSLSKGGRLTSLAASLYVDRDAGAE
ncbi:hypothetical protein [Brucella pituitosa]|uniref:hypothetical protein n=1 Tax=Brucella pituitosa TaxID=571256 RepID=UPI000C27CF90|nr:hypothetical protein [Brucella pituitosa]PJO47195.1 hypothetical protein CWE02_19215 [Brucella pituitosa]